MWLFSRLRTIPHRIRSPEKDFNMEIAESAEVAADSTDILRELGVLRVKVFTEPQQSKTPVERSRRLKNRGIHPLGWEKTPRCQLTYQMFSL
jgi:hypothetical protein